MALCWRSPADRPVAKNGESLCWRNPQRSSPSEGHVSASMLLSSALQLSKDKGSFQTAYDIFENEPLARGAFALVWRCRLRKATSGMVYVVKRIERSRLQKVDRQNLFGFDGRDGEIRLHSKLIHPNIVRLISVYEEPEVVSVVLESCHGGDLFEHISAHRRTTGGGVSAQGAATCMRQLLGALTFLHTGRVVHRDVKSENVLLCQEGVLLERNTFKLGDFGFAVCLNQVKGGKLYTVMGSPSTVAPEVLQNKSYGTAADLWSAGVVLYNLLSATQPFKANSPQEIMKKVKAGAFSLDGPVWENIDDDPKDLLLGLMCINVETRLRAPQALLHSFLVPDLQSSDSRSTLRSSVRRGVTKGGPCLSRSITADSIAEDAGGTPPCCGQTGTDFADLQTHAEEYTSARSSRLPSIATITTEASAADSEYGLSNWQIDHVRRMTPAPSIAEQAGVESDSPGELSPFGNPLLSPPTVTRTSRMTSSPSDSTVGGSGSGSAYGTWSPTAEARLGHGASESSPDGTGAQTALFATPPSSMMQPEPEQEQEPISSMQPPAMDWWSTRCRNGHAAAHTLCADSPPTDKHQKADASGDCKTSTDLDKQRQAEITAPMPVFQGGPAPQAALDVLASRLQETHSKSPRSGIDTDAEEEEQEELFEEVTEDPGDELSPFIYRRRKITDQYGDNFTNQDAHAKQRACCGCHTAPEDLPWWQRLFF